MYSLPNEVILLIFEYLNYTSLKQCSLVSRQFASLISHKTPSSIIDRNLFRDIIPINNPRTPLDIHPIFNRIWYNNTPIIPPTSNVLPIGMWITRQEYNDFEDVANDPKALKRRLSREWGKFIDSLCVIGKTEKPLSSWKAYKENATSPAVSELLLKIKCEGEELDHNEIVISGFDDLDDRDGTSVQGIVLVGHVIGPFVALLTLNTAFKALHRIGRWVHQWRRKNRSSGRRRSRRLENDGIDGSPILIMYHVEGMTVEQNDGRTELIMNISSEEICFDKYKN